MTATGKRPRIGLFDSGIGGLSVLRHAMQQLPADYLYVADSARAPYGDADPDWVRQRCLEISRFLVDQQVEAVVIACNTATALAAESIRNSFSLPVVAMEPAVKPAARETRTGRIAVLATRTTLASSRYLDLKARHAAGLTVLEYAPHHWIEAIEQGRENDPDFLAVLQHELQQLADEGVDTWVLACTHFPLLDRRLHSLLPASARIIDPAPAVTAQLRRQVGLPQGTAQGASTLKAYTSGPPDHLARRIAALGLAAQAISPLPLP